MKLSSYRRIYDQDYQGPYQSLVSQLATPINAAFTELYNLGNNNITFQENISCTISSFNITVDSTGKPKNATQFTLSSNQTTVSGLWVINTVNQNNSTTYPPGAVQVSFTKSNNNVVVNNVTGLTASTPYTITIIAIS